MSQDQYLSCMEACHACVIACNQCVDACLQEPDPSTLTRCIMLNLDCAQLCELAVATMSRSSESAVAICELCADVCQACEEVCGGHPMQHCQACAQACQVCVKECLKMATMH